MEQNPQAGESGANESKQQKPELLIDSVGAPLSPVINEQKKPEPPKPSGKTPQGK